MIRCGRTPTGSWAGCVGGQSLRGYLSGSIDAVLRVRDGDGHRYLVVDLQDQPAR